MGDSEQCSSIVSSGELAGGSVGAAVHTGAAVKMFDAAARLLRPGGELWTVYNTHLNYRGILQRTIGRTEVAGRNRKFTVTRSVRTR